MVKHPAMTRGTKCTLPLMTRVKFRRLHTLLGRHVARPDSPAYSPQSMRGTTMETRGHVLTLPHTLLRVCGGPRWSHVARLDSPAYSPQSMRHTTMETRCQSRLSRILSSEYAGE